LFVQARGDGAARLFFPWFLWLLATTQEEEEEEEEEGVV
jgi:hypothetical protein